MKQNETVFEVGMTVYHAFIGDKESTKGKVIRIADGDYPIVCEFGNGSNQNFTLDGRFYKSNDYPNLSTTPYTVKLEGFSQEKQYNLEKGQIVWVRDREDGDWLITYFIEKLEDGRFKCNLSPNENRIAFTWKYLTPNNPYENK